MKIICCFRSEVTALDKLVIDGQDSYQGRQVRAACPTANLEAVLHRHQPQLVIVHK